MKVGIAIDSWKLKIFDRRLTKAGFVYKKLPGVTANTLLLTVEVKNKDAIFEIVKSSQAEATRVSKK